MKILLRNFFLIIAFSFVLFNENLINTVTGSYSSAPVKVGALKQRKNPKNVQIKKEKLRKLRSEVDARASMINKKWKNKVKAQQKRKLLQRSKPNFVNSLIEQSLAEMDQGAALATQEAQKLADFATSAVENPNLSPKQVQAVNEVTIDALNVIDQADKTINT